MANRREEEVHCVLCKRFHCGLKNWGTRDLDTGTGMEDRDGDRETDTTTNKFLAHQLVENIIFSQFH